MLSILLNYLEQAVKLRWLFITIPAVLGIIILFIGFILLPDRPSKFFLDSPPLLEMNLVTYCANEKSKSGEYTGKRVWIDSLIGRGAKVYLTRTGETEFQMLVDIYGLIGKKREIFSSISNMSKIYFSDKKIDDVISSDTNPLPGSINHYCEKIRIIVNPRDSMKVSLSGELWIDYKAGNDAGTIVLRKPELSSESISDFKMLLIKERDAESGFEIKLPETNSDNLPPRIIGIRFKIECKKCSRGNKALTDIAMSLFLMKRGGGELLGQYHFLPVHAVANEQYIPTVWDGRKKGTVSEQHSDGYDMILSTELLATTLYSTWLDYDADRKTTGRYTMAGVIIGLGLTLMIEAIIAALYHIFYIRENRNNT